MLASEFFHSMVQAQKQGESKGICAICSAHPIVLEAAMEHANGPLLIEATANQINQFGGYTGMLPADFRRLVYGIAEKAGMKQENIILGGDHLGPLVWAKESEASAMQKAQDLVALFVSSGFTKIHIDTSMRLASDDADAPLSDEVIARRAATLLKAAEQAKDDANPPVYVIGSEVPIPGGATENEDTLQVTSVDALQKTIRAFHDAFAAEGLQDAWRRVVGIVAQPGVEFADNSVIHYDRAKAGELVRFMRGVDHLVLEGHSTDYQTPENLLEMKQDGIAILKVGPAVTFALREGIFALEHIERALHPSAPAGGYSDFAKTLDAVMLEKPENWIKHYHGTEREIALQRMFSLSDRCRYYMLDARVEAALDRLARNAADIPLGLLMQYMPKQADKVLAGALAPDAMSLMKDKVKDILSTYEL